MSRRRNEEMMSHFKTPKILMVKVTAAMLPFDGDVLGADFCHLSWELLRFSEILWPLQKKVV